MKLKLLEIASQYNSIEDIKANNYSKYLLLRRHGLLGQAFPPTKQPSKPIIGIFFVFIRTTIHYVGYSTTDLKKAAKAYMDKLDNPKARLQLFKVTSKADIIALSTYLIQKKKPLFNTEVAEGTLSFHISNVQSILGKPIKL